MFYTFKNTNVTIDDNQIFIEKCDISQSTSLNPLYLNNQRHSFNYSPTENISTSIKLTYYLTGQDPFKAYLSDEKNTINGNLAGLTFDSAYLKNYKVDFNPNAPAKGNVELVYFDTLGGNFTPTTTDYPNCKFLNFNLASITQSNVIEDLTRVTEGSFTFNSEITPFYYINNVASLVNFKPDRVVFGKKEITTEITCDTLTGKMSLYGDSTNIKVELIHPDNSIYNENFQSSGVIFQRQIGAAKEGNLQSSVSIKQNKIGKTPIISNVTVTGNSVSVDGDNFENIVSIYLGYKPIKNYTINSLTNITFNLTPELLNGFLVINTWEGSVNSPSQITFSYVAPSIINISPIQASAGQEVTVFGNDFHDIDDVKIAKQSVFFRRGSSQLLYVTVPDRQPMGAIEVSSSSRAATGTLTSGLFTPPYIDGFTPQTGINGSIISVSGANFSGLSNVYFNGISATYSVSNTGLLIATVPTGNVLGYISLKNSGNYSVSSTYNFNPIIFISGVSPASGKSLTPLTISGVNFQTGYMYAYDANTFGVTVGGVQTGFYRVSNILLTGLVPNGSISGGVFINRPDGVTVYSSSGNFNKLPDAPIITSVSPTSVISGNLFSFSVGGTQLNSVNQMYLSGVTGIASGKQIIIYDINHTSLNNSTVRSLNTSLSNDLFGVRSNIFHTLTGTSLTDNAFLTGIQTGIYNLYAVNAAGTGLYLSGVAIRELQLLSRLSSTSLSLSSYATGGISGDNNYNSGFFGAIRTVDGITGGSGPTGNYCSTSTGINPYLNMKFGGFAQIHRIDLWPRNDANYFSNSGANSQWCEIQLISGGNVIQSGSGTFGAGIQFASGFTSSFVTGTRSWRWEADNIKFIAHRQAGGIDIGTNFQMSEIEVRGIL